VAGIYIHIPFCKQACHYCDFHFSTSLKKKATLIDALVAELQLRKTELKDEIVETIYFGGGTPSLLTIEELQLLLDTVYENYKIVDNPEITLEANPDDLTETKIKALSTTKINRLSIGIQSFFDDDLQRMNRAHSAEESKTCLSLATQYFDNITIDLIYGIPNMSIEKLNDNLQQAFSFGVQHISAYALTVESKTALESFIKKGAYPPVDEALALEHFNHLVAKTEQQGFVQYEISNFGKPDFFSKHNTSYWQGKLYLGVGPSAHSYNGNNRSWNVANNSKYIEAIEKRKLPSTTEQLSKQDRFNEYIMTGLRTIWGVSLSKIETDFDLEYKQYLVANAKPFIDDQKLIMTDNLVLEATNKGKFLVDGIASELFIID